MLTIDALRQFGANTQEGLARCMNNESFYLRLVDKALEEASFEKLAAALGNGDKQAAFDAAHSLKGVLGNLALTPLYEPASAMTELLRAGKDADYPALLKQILQQRDALRALRDEACTVDHA